MTISPIKYRSPEEWNAPGKTWYISSEFGYRFSPTHQKTLVYLGLDVAKADNIGGFGAHFFPFSFSFLSPFSHTWRQHVER